MYLSFPTILLLFLHPVVAMIPHGITIKEPKCWYVANPGPCDDFVKVWGYDYMTNRCIFFYYGGCGGNPNRFYTKEECLDTCRVHRPPNRKKREGDLDVEEEEEEFEEDIDNWDKWVDWDHSEL
ncbi:kunitz-type serine protease inhibitor homolog beta-bungarotoxin B6 chain [Drosophila teissieri]|uniref:kunitz-type serine protease inhibitor homolog beta-bungarotoxin B6 chain n=1 Tax=Drosophila teissieri TaxID=7243 RepID=UPI001CB9E4CD|nr:kunitz-type serine protease inhibitor homolog beta-bungarotoxin B6 chain [Drosophila teissieri]